MVRNIRKVLISDPVDPICAQILEGFGLEITYALGWTKERLLQEIQVDCLLKSTSFFTFPDDCLVVSSTTKCSLSARKQK